jgi:hypothetical protein
MAGDLVLRDCAGRAAERAGLDVTLVQAEAPQLLAELRGVDRG